MQESWETANELLANTVELEGMMARIKGGTDPTPLASGGTPGGEERFQELWQKQQHLWNRSRRLYDENLGHGFTHP
jgi:hypothetical protein